MHTEHLQNVRLVRVVAGWLVSIAMTSIAVFALIVLGAMQADVGRDSVWAIVAVAAGFGVGGWFTGYRTIDAPILHGIAIGLTSLVAWVALNLVVALAFGRDQWASLSASVALVVLLTTIVAAVLGCRLGAVRARARASEVSAEPVVGVRERDIEPPA